MSRKLDTKHYVNHNFRNEIIVPLVAISNNIDFLTCIGEKTVTTKDDVVCKVVEFEEKQLPFYENDIKRLYNMDGWSFLKIWCNANKSLDSVFFIKMKLEKI